MVDDKSFTLGHLVGRRRNEHGAARPVVRKRPKMPSTPWRVAATICFLAGATIAWAVSQSAPGATIVVRTVLGGLFGLAIGMYIVETVWERKLRRDAAPTSPIGRRR